MTHHKVIRFLLFSILVILSPIVFYINVQAQEYDCLDPYYNDPKLVGCTDCYDKCANSITYSACMYWCKGNNECKGCSPCPNGKERSSTGNCICTNDACCQADFGEGGIWNGNDTDGCTCAEGTTWDGVSCSYPACGGDYTRHENGTCICGGESCCDRLFGTASVWNGNGTDGCTCEPGTIWNGSTCACTGDSCCQSIAGDALFDGNTNDGCGCMPGAVAQGDQCVCGFDYIPSPEQRTCICGDNSCCQRVFGDAHFEYSATDGCSCNSNATWDGSKCITGTFDNPPNDDDGDCYCNGRKLTVLEMLDAEPGECPFCPSDNEPDGPNESTPTPPEDLCSNGVKDNGEEGVDCGGSCSNSCEWSINSSPKEVDMTADGVTKQEFIVRVIVDGTPSSGQDIKLELNDLNNSIDNDKEGILRPAIGKTNENGEFKFTYQTQEQKIDFKQSIININAIHENGTVEMKINLIPSVSVQCGNWICEEGENNANCSQDCARDISYDQALAEIQKRYKNNIKLNPYYPEGTGSFQIYFTGMRNNFPKGLADGYLTIFETIEGAGGWIGEKLNMGSPDLSSTKKAYEKISQQYDPYTCGSYQTKITHMLNSLKWSNDATERKIISYFDYAPVTTNIPAHESVMIYPNGTDWNNTAIVLDPWLMNNHNAYPMSVWSGWGITAGVACDQHPNYPACNKDYQIPNGMRNDLNAEEKKFYEGLNNEIKSRINSSVAHLQRYVDLFKSQRNYELANKYKDELNNQKSYIIQELMYSDRFNKVEVVVDCPVRVLITDNLTGKRTGIDQEGNLINEIPNFLPDLRLLGNSDIYSYFSLPKDGDYKVEMFGLEEGNAEVYKSIPTEDGKFETYTYSGIPVSETTSMNTVFSNSNKGQDIVSGSSVYSANKNIVEARNDEFDSILNVISGDDSDEDIHCEKSSGLGAWTYVFLCFGTLFILTSTVGIIIIIKNKKKKVLGVLIIISGVCVGCTFVSIPIGSWLFSGESCYVPQEIKQNNELPDSSEVIEGDSIENDNMPPDPEVQGFIENKDYNFSIFVGEYAPDMEVVSSGPDWAVMTYDYCIPVESDIVDSTCGEGKYGMFNISILNDQQYSDEVINSPLGDMYDTIFASDGLNIVFSKPNGEVPVELNLPENFYNDVMDSFTILDDGSVG